MKQSKNFYRVLTVVLLALAFAVFVLVFGLLLLG